MVDEEFDPEELAQLVHEALGNSSPTAQRLEPAKKDIVDEPTTAHPLRSSLLSESHSTS